MIKKLFSLFAALLFVGSMWAAENDTHDFAQTVGNQSLNKCATLTGASIAEQSYPVKEVIVSIAYNKSNSPTVSVSVGGNDWGTKTLTQTTNLTTYETYSFTGEATTGAIVVSMENDPDNCSSTGRGSVNLSNVRLVEGVSAGAVKSPTFTPTDGDFENLVTVTMASETDGAAIYYTTKESAKATPATTGDWAAYNSASKPSFSETTTIWAAAKQGDDWSSVSSKTYTKVGIFTCANVYSLADDAKVSLNDVTVTYVNGPSVYVKDESGAMLLYLPANATWNAGDVLSGVKGTLDIYQGLYEVKPTAAQVENVTATAGTAPEPVELKAVPTSADMNKYVKFNNVSVATATFTTASASQTTTMTINSDDVQLRNGFKKAITFADGTHYNVVGVVNYNTNITDNEVHVYPISAAEKPCESTINITKAANPANGTFTLNNSGEVCIEYGNASTTVTATPAEHYHLATVTSKGEGDVNVGTVGDIAENSCTITGIDANTTVAVTFAEDPKSVVTWSVNGDESLTTEVYNGEKPTFPATPAAPASFGTSTTFIGWATTAWAGKLANIDSKTVYTKASDMLAVTDDVTYFAVFAKATESTPTKTYGFENEETYASDWTISEAIAQDDTYQKSGSYAGKINTNNTYITFKDKVYVTSFSFWFTRTSKNENYNVYIETSADGTSWTAAKTTAMSTFAQDGTFSEVSQDFDGEEEVYVRFHCSNTTAVRYVDDLSITYKGHSYSDYMTITPEHTYTLAWSLGAGANEELGEMDIVLDPEYKATDSYAKYFDKDILTVGTYNVKLFEDGVETAITTTLEINAVAKYALQFDYDSAKPELTATASNPRTPTSIDNTELSNKAVKFIQNGQLFIELNGHIYNVQGQIVK